MIDSASFALFLGGALILNVTPGPDMAFTLASTARGGSRTGLAAAAGVGAGSLVWAAATALGLAAILAASEQALTFIRVAGGLYLLYLAARVFLSKDDHAPSQGAKGTITAFRSGFLTNLFNPKVGLFFLAFLPGFVSVDENPALTMFVLGAVFSFSGACVLALVALAAGALREGLSGSVRFSRIMKALSGTMFGGLGIYLLASGER